MKPLIAVELRRLLGRRLLLGLTALAVVGFAIAGLAAYAASDDSPRAVAEAALERERVMRECVANVERQRSTGPAPSTAPAAVDPQEFCDEQVWVADPRFRYSDITWILGTLAIPLMMLAWLIGASFIGAEWHSRSLTTLLTWEPRRVRVLGAKALAVIAVLFLWALLLEILLAGALYPAGEFEGSMAGVNGQWFRDLFELMLRVGAMAAGAGLMGLSLATIGRNTAAAFGVGFLYLSAVEGLIRAFRPSWRDWLIGDNVGMFVIGSEAAGGLGQSRVGAGFLLLAYIAIAVASAAAVFRAREVA